MAVQTGRHAGNGVAVAVSHVDGDDRAAPLLVCVPGGGFNRHYFDVPGVSLLARAEANGQAAIAVDRPGYGDSDALTVEKDWFPAQAAILDAVIGAAWAAYGQGRPGVVLVGHSFGATIALRIAARMVSWPLLGVAVYGTSDATTDGMTGFAQGIADLPALTPMALEPAMIRSFFYGPDGTYDPAVLDAAGISVAPAPAIEIREWAFGWPQDAAGIAATITVPVHIRMNEHDAVQDVNQEALDRFAGLFTAAPSVDAAIVAGSGHNTDLHHAGEALQLDQFAFARRCAVAGC
jgi:pimeloyl-ACP methyl ester carboxylesterase